MIKLEHMIGRYDELASLISHFEYLAVDHVLMNKQCEARNLMRFVNTNMKGNGYIFGKGINDDILITYDYYNHKNISRRPSWYSYLISIICPLIIVTSHENKDGMPLFDGVLSRFTMKEIDDYITQLYNFYKSEDKKLNRIKIILDKLFGYSFTIAMRDDKDINKLYEVVNTPIRDHWDLLQSNKIFLSGFSSLCYPSVCALRIIKDSLGYDIPILDVLSDISEFVKILDGPVDSWS